MNKELIGCSSSDGAEHLAIVNLLSLTIGFKGLWKLAILETHDLEAQASSDPKRVASSSSASFLDLISLASSSPSPEPKKDSVSSSESPTERDSEDVSCWYAFLDSEKLTKNPLGQEPTLG